MVTAEIAQGVRVVSDRAVARQLLIRAVWFGQPAEDTSSDALESALALARRNEVEAPFVRTYADDLSEAARQVAAQAALFRSNLVDVCALLDAAGIKAILIKALPTDAYTYTNFDLVVGEDAYARAKSVLRGWADRSSVYPLERATKILLYPAGGPAAHLHREVAWFDIPAIPTDALRREAHRPEGSPCDLPSPAMAFLILLAHAAFQNLALGLGDLVTYRRLTAEVDVGEARQTAISLGWGRGFRDAQGVAERTIERLDAGELPALPAMLPAASGLLGGIEHGFWLARRGAVLPAVRELVLRGPLVVAKLRRRRDQ